MGSPSVDAVFSAVIALDLDRLDEGATRVVPDTSCVTLKSSDAGVDIGIKGSAFSVRLYVPAQNCDQSDS